MDVVIPALGESVTEATIGQWLKKVGDAVQADEPIVSLETDKVAVEVNAPAGLPTRVPLAHSAPSESMKCFIGAAMLPKRVGLPSSKPAHSARSRLST